MVDAGFVNVAKYIIKKTPIGHLGKALENLRSVVGEQVMDTNDVKKEIHNYGETHLSPVNNEVTNSKVVISPLTKDSEGFYHDQGQKVKFKIGLESGAVEEAQSTEIHNDLRDAIESKVKEYLEKCYKMDVTKYNVYFDGSSNKIVVLISVHNLNLKSFWSGEWLVLGNLILAENKLKELLELIHIIMKKEIFNLIWILNLIVVFKVEIIIL